MRSRAGYWIGGGLVAAGVLGAVLWFVISLMNLDNRVDDFQRVPLPGEATVQLEAHKYVIYYEGANADEGVVPGFEIAIADARTGAELEIAPYGGSLTYSFGSAGSAQGTVTPPDAGAYWVRTDGGAGTTGERVALGRSLAAPLVAAILGTFAIGGLLCGAGVILLVVTGIRRHRARRAPAPTYSPP